MRLETSEVDNQKNTWLVLLQFNVSAVIKLLNITI